MGSEKKPLRLKRHKDVVKELENVAICKWCKGTGKVGEWMGNMRDSYYTDCPECDGTGKTDGGVR